MEQLNKFIDLSNIHKSLEKKEYCSAVFIYLYIFDVSQTFDRV